MPIKIRVLICLAFSRYGLACKNGIIFLILFDMLINPSFKMRTSFANIARTTVSTSKFIY